MASERAWLRRAEAVAGKLAAALKRIQGSDEVYDQVMASRDCALVIGTASVASGATATLASYTVPASPALWRLWGFKVWAAGVVEPTDAKAWLEIGGVEGDADEIHAGNRIARSVLPAPLPVANTVTVALKVRNRGQTTTTFIGTILGDA